MAEKKDVKRYKCMNFGACAKADSGEIIEIDALETIGGAPDCPHCHQHTLEEQIVKPTNWKLIGGIAAAVVVLGGAGTALMLGGGGKEEPIITEPQKVETVDTAKVDTVAKPVEPVKEVKEEPVKEEPQKVKPQKPATPQNGYVTNYNLGYGTYTGDIKNGKPHGHGTITYKTSHTITGSYVADPGDKYEGDFRDGRVSGGLGYWTHEGNMKTINP
ncbi:MAG: hypothetical protein J6O54_05600 [Prevotella sp.]|nr:hypothetical protein [Prevotella sp.]